MVVYDIKNRKYNIFIINISILIVIRISRKNAGGEYDPFLIRLKKIH